MGITYEENPTAPDNELWEMKTFMEAVLDASQICEGTQSFLQHHHFVNNIDVSTDLRSEQYEAFVKSYTAQNVTGRDDALDYNITAKIAPFLEAVSR